MTPAETAILVGRALGRYRAAQEELSEATQAFIALLRNPRGSRFPEAHARMERVAIALQIARVAERALTDAMGLDFRNPAVPLLMEGTAIELETVEMDGIRIDFGPGIKRA